MLRIVMDSAGDLPAGWAEQYGISVIPVNIHFKEQTFLQGIDLSDEDFYRMARQSGVIPQTSQPSPQQFVDFYKKIAEPGDTILSVHVTSKLSGTLASAEMAARELSSTYQVLPVDSGCGSAAQGYLCRDARLMDRQGNSPEQIVAWIERIRPEISIILTLDTLEFARRSGRVKALQAALASILNVKPIIVLTNGVLDMADRVRTRGKALDFVLESTRHRLGDRPARVGIVHSQDPKSAEILRAGAERELNCRELITTSLSIAVAANLGPGTVGVTAYPVDGE
jgi:DegV family protein with EDD domain